MRNDSIKKICLAGIMAALCYVGYAIFPAISVSGTKVHLGNAFVVLGALMLGGLYGGLAGAVGLSLADILGGFSASAPRTFITKLVIGLIVGLVAHRLGHLNNGTHTRKNVTKWSIFAALAGLGFNCIFEPALKYVWYTLLTPNADKAQAAIASLMAVTTVTTLINTVINSIAAILLYTALRPVMVKANILETC